MHAAAIDLRGGVSPRGTLLRGQSIIEYVLIIGIDHDDWATVRARRDSRSSPPRMAFKPA